MVGRCIVVVGLLLVLNACAVRQLGRSGAEGVLDETMRVLSEEDEQLGAIAADPTLQRAIAEAAAAFGRGTAAGVQDVYGPDEMKAELLELLEDPRFHAALEESSVVISRGAVIGSDAAMTELSRAREPRSMLGQLRNLLTIERVLSASLRVAHIAALLVVAYALLRAVHHWERVMERSEARMPSGEPGEPDATERPSHDPRS